MCCFRSSYYLALCLLDSDICALACPEVCVPEVCVHSSENDTDLSKKDVKWGQNRRNKAGEAVCEFYRRPVFVWEHEAETPEKHLHKLLLVFDWLETSEACGNTIQTAKSAAIIDKPICLSNSKKQFCLN